MKRVSFEVAEYIKKIGYPQDYIEYYYDYNECMQKRDKCYVNCQCVAPTYLEVWLWLWREKGTPIHIDYSFCRVDVNINDPEEAIITAIEYLVNNNLIK